MLSTGCNKAGAKMHIQHTSSMNTIAGECSLARLNSWLTSFSLSPIHLETRSLEETVKNVDSASVATACAPSNAALDLKAVHI